MNFLSLFIVCDCFHRTTLFIGRPSPFVYLKVLLHFRRLQWLNIYWEILIYFHFLSHKSKWLIFCAYYFMQNESDFVFYSEVNFLFRWFVTSNNDIKQRIRNNKMATFTLVCPWQINFRRVSAKRPVHNTHCRQSTEHKSKYKYTHTRTNTHSHWLSNYCSLTKLKRKT